MQLKEEWRSFLSNIKSIKENRRITNFPYAFAIINIHIIYTWTMLILLASVLGGRVTMTVDKGITMSATSPFLISGPTFFWCAAILVFITNLLVAVLIKRRSHVGACSRNLCLYRCYDNKPCTLHYIPQAYSYRSSSIP